MSDPSSSRGRIGLAYAHGAFFVASGLWPIVHLRSFARVTGPKPEGWLVKTVGGLLAVVGTVLIDSARRRRVDRTVAMLGAGSAATLATIDFIYASRRRIAPVYLLDGALQLGLVAAWALVRR